MQPASAASAADPACPNCPAPTPCPGCWQPPLDARWQYQLQAKPGVADDTGGIDVDICAAPAAGGDCVTPNVFDIDLYVDTKVSGAGQLRGGYRRGRCDPRRGRDMRSATWTPATPRRTGPTTNASSTSTSACGGCLIGNPFSQVFPDEFFLNINNDQGQRAFILKVNRDRVQKCADAGFDAVEWDIIDTYEDPHSGFHISYRSQLMFNSRLANLAHHYGMSVAMKNDPSQVKDLLPYFDFAIVEQCFQYALLLGRPGSRRGRVRPGGQGRLRGGVPAHARRVLRGRRHAGDQRDQEEPQLLAVRDAVPSVPLIGSRVRYMTAS